MKRMILVGCHQFWHRRHFRSGAMADVVCRGRVLDEQGEPAVGAVVAVPGSKPESRQTLTEISRSQFRTTPRR